MKTQRLIVPLLCWFCGVVAAAENQTAKVKPAELIVDHPTLINLGCRTNAAETDEVAGLLADARNYVLINSCTVTTAADRDTRKAVARARRERP